MRQVSSVMVQYRGACLASFPGLPTFQFFFKLLTVVASRSQARVWVEHKSLGTRLLPEVTKNWTAGERAWKQGYHMSPSFISIHF